MKNIDSKVRFGVIGTNYITDNVLACAFNDPRFELTAVYSRTMERGQMFAAKYGVENVFCSLEDMAASGLVDAVYVASPNASHARQAIFFLERGIHVLCEKAFASNTQEVRAMIEAARGSGATLMEALMPTVTPNFRTVINSMPLIGTPRKYFSAYCQYSARYNDFKQGIIHNAFRADMASGAAMDIGIYTIYPMAVLFGKPKSIKATGTLLHTGVDGQGSAVLEYDGLEATIVYSKICQATIPTEIVGEDGTLKINKSNIMSTVTFTTRSGEATDLSQPHPKGEYFYEIEEFINLINNNEQQSKINSWDASITAMEILDEIRRQVGYGGCF